MAVKSLYLMIFALLAFSSLFDVSAALGGRKILAPAPAPGPNIDADNAGLAPVPANLGFTLLNTKDPKMIDLAKFAVDEYNKANNAKLIFSQVVEATSTIDGQEMKYELVISGTNGKDLDFYYIKISVANDVKKVISFSQNQS